MKLLLTLTEADINPTSLAPEPAKFRLRRAARAVVLGSKNEVALLKVNKHAYYKLPGGGIDEDEDIPTALARELMEEIGCKAKVIAEIGEVVEYRNQWDLKQVSYCFLARQQGDRRTPNFTETEIAEGFEIVWVDSIEDAIALLEQDSPENYDGHFIQKRDTAILRAAQQLI